MDVLPLLLNNLLVLLQDAVNKPWKFRKGGGGEPEQPEKSCTGERQRRRVERKEEETRRGCVATRAAAESQYDSLVRSWKEGMKSASGKWSNTVGVATEKEDRKRGRKRREETVTVAEDRMIAFGITKFSESLEPILVWEIHENSRRKRRKREEGGEVEGKKGETRGGWLGHCLKRVRFSVSSFGIGEKKDEKRLE